MENLLSEIVVQMLILSWVHMTLTYARRSAVLEENEPCDNSLLLKTRDGMYHLKDVDLCSKKIEIRATEEHITFYYYSRNYSAVDLTRATIGKLRKTDFCVKHLTIFLIHGWRGSPKTHFSRTVLNALLVKHHTNLFLVDWSPVAERNYFSARNAVQVLGNFVAAFIKSLVSTYDLKLSRVAFVGHSLGAHISGNAGATLKGEVSYILGLDPAGPFFTVPNKENRLDETDAKFVEIIHSDGGYLGFWTASGHADYYPNGGSAQPGCGWDLFGKCAHGRAFVYYAESLSTENSSFVAWKCPSYYDFSQGKCRENGVSLMAGYIIDTNASGTYFLDTNDSPPYAKGPSTV